MNDDAIRDVLSPLRASDPIPDVGRLVARGRREKSAHRRRRGLALGAVTAMAAGVLAAALPAGDQPLTARSVLHAAAAAAADQPPQKITGIRYVKVDYRILLQPHDGSEQYRFTRAIELWVGRDGTTRAESGPGFFTYLDGREHARPSGMPPVEATTNDEQRMEFSRLDVADLPTDPARLRAELEAAALRTIDERFGRNVPPGLAERFVAYLAIELLSYASLTPDQRSALFQMLADTPRARVIADDTVEIETSGIGGEADVIRTTLVVDRDTGALRSRTERPGDEPYIDGDRVEQSWTFVESRDVEAVGVR